MISEVLVISYHNHCPEIYIMRFIFQKEGEKLTYPIRNISNRKHNRLFDLEVEKDGIAYIVVKQGREYEKLPWRMFEYQVEAAMREAASSNPISRP